MNLVTSTNDAIVSVFLAIKYQLDLVKANGIMRQIKKGMCNLKKIRKNLNGLLNKVKRKREFGL